MARIILLIFIIGCSQQKNLVAPIVAITDKHETTQSTYPTQLAREIAHSMKLNKNVSVSIVSSNEQYAFSSENGTILISAGLIRTIPNEASFAFIIAHELSHIYLQHQEDDANEEDADKLGLMAIFRAGFSPHHAVSVLAHGRITDSRRANIQDVLKSLPIDFTGIVDREIFQYFRQSLSRSN